MFDIAAVTTASLVCAAGVVSPGPNFVAVTHRAVSSPRAETSAFVLGVVSINVLWASLALFGLNALMATHQWLFTAVKLLGGAYLIWFGAHLIRRSKTAGSWGQRNTSSRRSTALLGLRDGLVTNLSNPKSLLFYASVFSSAVPSDASRETLAAILVMVAMIAMLWYGGVGIALSARTASNLYRGAKPIIEQSCGSVLIAFGFHQMVRDFPFFWTG